MKIEETKDRQLIESICKDDVILQMTDGDKSKYKADLNHLWLLIKENDEIIGLGEFIQIKTITWECHIRILPKYQGKGIALEGAKKGIVWLRHNTVIRNVIAYIPYECEHVFKFLKKLEFIPSGIIKNGIIFHNKLQDLILLSKNIRG